MIISSEPIDALHVKREECIAKGDWSGAAKYSVAIADALPEEAGPQRSASGELERAGQLDDALIYAKRACALNPQAADYKLHLAALLNRIGHNELALPILLDVVTALSNDPEVHMQIIAAAVKSDNLAEAQIAASKLLDLAPTSEPHVFAAAWVYELLKDWAAVVSILDDYHRLTGRDTAMLRRKKSGALLQNKDYEAALSDIEQAIEWSPDLPEYYIHQSSILLQMGRMQDAHEAAHFALSLDPSDLSARRHLVTALIAIDDIEGAIRCAGELLTQSPSNPEFASCMSYLLERQASPLSQLKLADVSEMKRTVIGRRIYKKATFFDGLRRQSQAIFALVLRDVRSRYGESRYGFLWAITEPLFHIGVLAIVFQFTMKGEPPIGSNFFLFYFTGVMPFLLVTHLISHIGHAVKGQRAMMQLPRIAPIDLVLSKAIVEMFTTGIVFLIFSGIFTAFGINAVPSNSMVVLGSLGLAALMGVGLGMMLAALSEFGQGAEQIANLLSRFLYFASGVFYVPEMMPLHAREILVWNPFLHVVDFIRAGYFESYDPFWLDVSYAFGAGLMCLVLGLISIRVSRKRMRVLK